MNRLKLSVALVAALIVNISAQAQRNPQAELQQMEARAKAIIAKMTMEEKISQLMNTAPGIDRLGIKPYDWWSEALHGVARTGRATVFPEPIGLAATFDPALVKRIGDAISTEGRAKFEVAQSLGNYARYAGLTYWAPNINIFRDPRWGRGMETYGEDPFLTGTIGTAFVHGVQGDDPVYLKAAACAKHFAVHSGPEGDRHSINLKPSLHDLYETYLPAFRMLVEDAKVEAIMGAYSRLYDESCSASKFLLTDVLRDDWHFNGHIVSDCGAVGDIFWGHKLVKSKAEAAAMAIKSGLNLECGDTMGALKEALEQNLVSEEDLDKALLPLMMTRQRLGILYPDEACPYNNTPESVICSPENTQLARTAAQESMVLLKNDNVLPISKNVKKILVSGPGATDTYYLMGNYYGIANRYCSYLQGIAEKVSSGTTIDYRPGFLATHERRNKLDWVSWEARWSDVTVVVLGNSNYTEGEEGEAIDSKDMGDRPNIQLPEVQMQFLRKASKDRHGKLITIVTGGSPIDLKEVADLSDVVIMAWYPGQEGGYALADLLFGDADFTGRLPITFPVSADVLPPFDDYSMQGRTYKYMEDEHILYPFGFGLTYGKVQYSEATATLSKNGLHVTATLENQSDRATTETVQIYLSSPTAGVASPKASLVAFDRVTLDANAKKVVSFDIPTKHLLTVGEDGKATFLKGYYQVSVGGAAPTPRSKALGVSYTTTTFRKK